MSDKTKAILGWVSVGLTAAGGVTALIGGVDGQWVAVQSGAIVAIAAGIIGLVKSFFNKAA